jgi:alkaline phosphatase
MLFSRRRFLQSSFVGASALSLSSSARSVSDGAKVQTKPTRIIHLVADGMSWGTLTCADLCSRRQRKRGLTWMQLFQNATTVSGLVDMRSLNSVVTDSAAASSSWSSGTRVKNGSLNELPDGSPLRPLFSLFGEAGWRRALVTTTEMTHATPAGFVVNAQDRNTGEAIAVQYLERPIDIFLGGGRDHFDGAKRKDKTDLRPKFEAAGYAVFQTADQLRAAPSEKRWLGLFGKSHLPFTVDQIHDQKLLQDVPTLAEMTRLALVKLSNAGQFIMQVEGGRVDHGAHACDAAAAIREMIAFDEALDVCLEFQKRQPETLLIITTDHATANLGINGAGANYTENSRRLDYVFQIKASSPEILKRLQKLGHSEKVPLESEIIEPGKDKSGKTTKTILHVEPKIITDIFGDLAAYKIAPKKAEWLSRFLAGEVDVLYDQMNSSSAQFGQLMANHLGIGFTGTAHTADFVPLAAIGPGAELFAGFIQNTLIGRNYLELAGIDFRNPDVPLLSEDTTPREWEDFSWLPA